MNESSFFEQRVQGSSEEEDVFDLKGKSPEEAQKYLKGLLDKYIKRAQGTVEAYHSFFSTFAKDSSLNFKMSDGFSFNHETGDVNMDVQWYFDRKFTSNQIIWAFLHEIMHFRDMIEDQDGHERILKHNLKNARRTGKMIMKKLEDSFAKDKPEVLDRAKQEIPFSEKDTSIKLTAVEVCAFNIHHVFYNVFDDIWVNHEVSRRAHKYNKSGSGGESIHDLYRDVLFHGTDMSHSPRHMQFTNSLLRDSMVPDEELLLSDDVRTALEQKIRHKGKLYTP